MALDKLTERKRDKTREKTRETIKFLDFSYMQWAWDLQKALRIIML